jgi:putative transposase
MSRRRHTPEQVVRKLRAADGLLGEGLELPEVIKQLEVSEQTYFRWRNQFGGMKADDVKRLKELEAENARLKRIVADQALDIQGLKELSRGRMKVKPLPRCFSVGVGRGASRRRCVRRPSRLGASIGARVRGGARG